MKEFIVTAVDTETTGLSQEGGHRIIEICLSCYKTTDGLTFRKMGKPWTKRINPLRSIDPGAEAVHGISLLSLRAEPEWSGVAPMIKKILDASDLVVAHNIAFDAPFIVLELMRIGLTPPNFECFCTMEKGRKATQMGKVPRLEELCFAMGVDYDSSEAHAASYDVEKMMECLFVGIKTGFYDIRPALGLCKENQEIAA